MDIPKNPGGRDGEPELEGKIDACAGRSRST